ncbi:hypothetical protein AVEN_27591-1 [Araneus ventricosus]|uniref:DUF4817 domain-containing protein n=1 Tax=Araneus ventricosus TaxID=182803 RepID=A0A4Y2Q1V1_ARAVE|nr:hypothetical protein AVEN_27591-1 [Araneus ventricosus]
MRRYAALYLQQQEIPNSSVKIATVQQKARPWLHENKSIVTVQMCFRLHYRNCQSQSKDSIKRRFDQFMGTGDVHHRKGSERPLVSDEVVKQVRETFTP